MRTHYSDVTMSAMASQMTSLTIVYWAVYSGTDQRQHQSSPSLAFVWGIHRWPVNSLHKWPVTRKLFSFEDVIITKWPPQHNNVQSDGHNKTIATILGPNCLLKFVLMPSCLLYQDLGAFFIFFYIKMPSFQYQNYWWGGHSLTILLSS